LLIEIQLKLKKWRWPVFVSLVVLALIAYWYTQIWLGPEVAGYVVRKDILIQSIVLNAEVEKSPSIEVSSKISGKVKQLNVLEGDSVSVGQVLLTLEGKDERATLDKARAATVLAVARFRKISEQTQAGSAQALQRAKATVENASKQYARINKLADQGLVSREQSADALRNLTIAHSQLANLEFQAKAMRVQGSEYAAAEKALSKARAAEHAIKDNLARQTVTAESAGILAASKVAEGDTVLPGKVLLLIHPLSKTRLLAQLEPSLARNLRPGLIASVTAGAEPELHFDAALNEVHFAQEAPQSMAALVFEVQNAAQVLSPGMTVTLAIELSKQVDALSVPVTAVHDAEGVEPWVMLAENGRSLRRTVKLGIRGQGKVEIVQGLREGDSVLLATTVEAGKRIRLASAG
jgi:HlyD family secretion protein